ncbi:hypothetical protein ACFOHW_21980 [Paenibacillus abyssi]
MKRTIHNISLRYSKQSGVPAAEFVSQLSEEIWVAYRDYDSAYGATLITWINGCLRRRAMDVIRERDGTYYRRVSLISAIAKTDEDEDAPTSEVAESGPSLEEYVIERMHRKKEADQRQLIDFLVNSDPDQVDPVTTLIVTKFPQYPSITALAKALGLHHEVVKRKLRALSRRYDANRFGDYREYLAV